MDTSKVTRVELIDDKGRAYVKYGVLVQLMLDDDDRTLKIFVKKGEPFVADMREWNEFCEKMKAYRPVKLTPIDESTIEAW